MATTATETEAKKTTTTSKGKHFWVVKLHCPPGASEGLRAYIAMAETAIQTAVDLLGRGMTTLPPTVAELLEPEIYGTLGSGKADDEYRAVINKVEAKQLQLLQMDDKVIKTSATVAAEQVQALRSIENIVEHLNTTLKAAGTGKLKSAQEQSLLKAVAQAVEAVYDKVIAIAELNDKMANGGGNNGSGGSNGSGGGANGGGAGGSTGGSGGGDGGLSSLLSTLAMLPMMALPLAQQIPQMLQNAEEQKQKKAEQDQKNGQQGQPGQTTPPGNQAAPAGAPQPGGPNAQPAAVETTTAQPGGITAAPAASTAPQDEPAGTSAAGTAPNVIQARRTRDVSAADRPVDGATQDATADEPEQDAGAVIDA
ncbi:hypothetical protein AB0346_14480 [Nocardia beijingensis]|uniref:hypothetical protein n=1 Tax=Nocardia beijingensis TaxID=95162 RepID=UPI00344DBE80